MADNSDIRGMIRDLALKRDSIDRRQLYFALIQAEVWVPVSVTSAAGHVTPGDLQPLDREGPRWPRSLCFLYASRRGGGLADGGGRE